MSFARSARLLAVPEPGAGPGKACITAPPTASDTGPAPSDIDISLGSAKWQQRWEELLAQAAGAGAAGAGAAGSCGGMMSNPGGGVPAHPSAAAFAQPIRRHHTIVLGDFGAVGTSLGSPRPLSSPTYPDNASSSGSFAFASGHMTTNGTGSAGGMSHGGGPPSSAALGSPQALGTSPGAGHMARIGHQLGGCDDYASLDPADGVVSGYFALGPSAPGAGGGGAPHSAPAAVYGPSAAAAAAAAILEASGGGEVQTLYPSAGEQIALARLAVAQQQHQQQQHHQNQQHAATLHQQAALHQSLLAAGQQQYALNATSDDDFSGSLHSCSGGLLANAGLLHKATPVGNGLFIPKSSSLYVKNLPGDADKCFLYERFAPYGAIMSVKVLCDQDTGICKGVGFVNFAEHDAAVRAMQALHGAKIHDKLLHVSLQTPRIRAVI